MIDPDRAERAATDILAVEETAPGMARVVTLTGCYTLDARGQACQCPDKEFNLAAGEFCKHYAGAILAGSDDLPTPFVVAEDFDERTEPGFELDTEAARRRARPNRKLDEFADATEVRA